MLPPLASVLPVGPATPVGPIAPIGDGRQAAFQRALQGLVGQSVTADVLSKFNDGSFLVKVADQAVRMMLPSTVSVGSQLPLTVLSADPRPTFQLGNGAPGSIVEFAYHSPASDGLYRPGLASQDMPANVPGMPRAPAGSAAAQPGVPTGDPGAASDADGTKLPNAAPAGTAQTAAASAALAKPSLAAATNLTTNLAANFTANFTANVSSDDGAPHTATTPTNSAADTGAEPAPGAARPDSRLGNSAATASANTPAGNGTLGADSEPVLAPSVPRSLAATLLGKAPLTPANELPALTPDTPPATLSNAARVLTSALGAGAQLALIGKTALFGNAAPSTEQLAQTLERSIAQSGLFYESHVLAWAKGERSLPELLREPQMQRAQQQGEQANAARAAANGPDLSAAQMINQQLHTHEQSRVQWHGEAWPGQAMQWEIQRDQRQRRDSEQAAEAEDAPEPIWRSGVRFRLPLLGAVSAAVTLVGDQVHIQVQADDGSTSETLRAHASALEQAMAAAGATLATLTISQGST